MSSATIDMLYFCRMLSKKERIAALETLVTELAEENKELNDAINAILKDIRDLQQFKRFVELSRTSKRLNLSSTVEKDKKQGVAA